MIGSLAKRLLKLVGGVFVVVVVLLVLGYATGIIGLPNVTVKEPGEWGTTTEETTEIETTILVENPNPIGVSLSDGFSARYWTELNGVRLVEGQRESISVPRGSSTVTLTSTLDNDKIVPWWVAYVRNDETIQFHATGNATIDAFGDRQVSFPAHDRTMLEDRRPVIEAFSAAVSTMEGEYTAGTGPATAGYEIRDASAEWATVTDARSNMTLTIEIHNPGSVPVALVPDGFRLDATANDVELFTASGDALTPDSVDRDAMLAPGETRTVEYTVTMTNDNVDDWFLSHVENGERSNLVIEPRLEFAVPETGTTITIPEDGVGYQCQFRTAILEDQESGSNCGSGGSVAAD
ncbi:LEA type 2 family protein [Halapricum hydrolyticum]|uniref:LEA type 2 family protein n=1 Tax=Halapricum hydrolyticum TaxID=2979991 RepID=A0AAE3ID35_9EURY|nr:LEA type 2 family protein [Halapricum hydrolyticum]MCU4719291.1 LEA type 2 family protein [Halapricum hydrolyticum]MCU4728166.1 LEA type 2 family protein [Halapricum hydrolyticum]